MSLTSRCAEFIYQVATTRKVLRNLATPVGILFWLGLLVVLVLASIWLDSLLPVRLPLGAPYNLLLGGALLLAGGALCLWCVYRFLKAGGSPVPLNPPRYLITTGLYSRVRNPMLLGWFMLLLGIGVSLGSISLTFLFTPLFIIANVVYIKSIEEKEMTKKFGDAYVAYKKDVPLFIPRFRKR